MTYKDGPHAEKAKVWIITPSVSVVDMRRLVRERCVHLNPSTVWNGVFFQLVRIDTIPEEKITSFVLCFQFVPLTIFMWMIFRVC